MYRFKLEALLNHRRHQEEIRQKELAQTERQLADERGKLNRLKEDKQENTQKLQAKQKIPINVSVIILSVNYIRQLAKNIEKQAECVRVTTRKVNQKRTELVMMVKKRKTLEKLKEKEQLVYQQKMLQNERKLMDEVAAIRHARKM
ncbi:MAG: flagellar export protein FliJ [bacterium]|nr:flagellar export protein FliJ [bacterium]